MTYVVFRVNFLFDTTFKLCYNPYNLVYSL